MPKCAHLTLLFVILDRKKERKKWNEKHTVLLYDKSNANWAIPNSIHLVFPIFVCYLFLPLNWLNEFRLLSINFQHFDFKAPESEEKNPTFAKELPKKNSDIEKVKQTNKQTKNINWFTSIRFGVAFITWPRIGWKLCFSFNLIHMRWVRTIEQIEMCVTILSRREKNVQLSFGQWGRKWIHQQE